MTINVGDKVLLFPDGRGGYTAYEISAPAVGEKCILLPDGKGGYTAVGVSAPSVGDKVPVVPDGKGGYITWKPYDDRVRERLQFSTADSEHVYVTRELYQVMEIDGEVIRDYTSVIYKFDTSLHLLSCDIVGEDEQVWDITVDDNYITTISPHFSGMYNWDYPDTQITRWTKDNYIFFDTIAIPPGASALTGPFSITNDGSYYYYTCFTGGYSGYATLRKASMVDLSVVAEQSGYPDLSAYSTYVHGPHNTDLTVDESLLYMFNGHIAGRDWEPQKLMTVSLDLDHYPDTLASISYTPTGITNTDDYLYYCSSFVRRYDSDPVSNKIVKCRKSDGAEIDEASCMGRPVAIDTDGENLYVTDRWGYVSKYDQDLKIIKTISVWDYGYYHDVPIIP